MHEPCELQRDAHAIYGAMRINSERRRNEATVPCGICGDLRAPGYAHFDVCDDPDSCDCRWAGWLCCDLIPSDFSPRGQSM